MGGFLNMGDNFWGHTQEDDDIELYPGRIGNLYSAGGNKNSSLNNIRPPQISKKSSTSKRDARSGYSGSYGSSSKNSGLKDIKPPQLSEGYKDKSKWTSGYSYGGGLNIPPGENPYAFNAKQREKKERKLAKERKAAKKAEEDELLKQSQGFFSSLTSMLK